MPKLIPLKVLDNHRLTDLHRGIRYGDGFFDTALLFKGRLIWAREHLNRLVYASEVMDLELPWNHHEDWERLVLEAWMNHGKPDFARIRTSIWRQQGKGYQPGGSTNDWCFELDVLEGCPFLKSEGVLRLGPSDIVKCPPVLPDIKSMSALPYILAELFALKNGWDDALLRAPNGGLIESSRSNLFYWKQGRCYTPDLRSGCLPGICANYLMEFLSNRGQQVEIVQAPPADLNDCTSIWLTNSIRGVQRVSHWNGLELPRQPEDDWVDEANRGILGS